MGRSGTYKLALLRALSLTTAPWLCHRRVNRPAPDMLARKLLSLSSTVLELRGRNMLQCVALNMIGIGTKWMTTWPGSPVHQHTSRPTKLEFAIFFLMEDWAFWETSSPLKILTMLDFNAIIFERLIKTSACRMKEKRKNTSE